jgi:hypothetical protein
MKSAKKILNEIDFFYRTNYLCSTKRTGHYAWPCRSFSWSNCACDHPSCRKICCSLRPCHCVDHNHGVNCLDDNSQVGDCCNRVGYFDGNCGTCDCDDDGSLIHGYVWQEAELFFFPLAASCPWQSS